LKICPSCQFYNRDERERCLRCDTILQHCEEVVKRPVKFRVTAIDNLTRHVRGVGTSLRRLVRSPIPEHLPYRYPWVAAWLSLLPGGGQLYNHQYTKAALFILSYGMLAAISVFTITKAYSNFVLGVFGLFVLFVYNDGLATAIRINGQLWTLRNSLAAFSYLLFAIGLFLLLGQFFFSPVFKFVHIAHDVLAPAVRKGDRLFVECVTYWFREPRRGDVVFYNPGRYKIEVRGTMYLIKERRSVERVMGIPGDRVERKDGIFYVNGNRIDSSYYPLVTDQISDNFSFDRVPKDRYLVLITHHSYEPGFMGFGGTSPRLDAPGIIIYGWKEACLVEKKEIIGRVLCIYNPPTHRKFLLPRPVSGSE
jgi:signal peptidase I